jgi:hypothetical protein
MNYTFRVIVKDGVMTFGRVSGDLPDGSYEVGGNEDEHGAGINVTHRLSNGQFVAEAQHYRSHYNYNPDNFAPIEPSANEEQVKAVLLAAGFSDENATAFARAGISAKGTLTKDGGQQVPVAPSAPADGVPRPNDPLPPPLPRRHPQGNVNFPPNVTLT